MVTVVAWGAVTESAVSEFAVLEVDDVAEVAAGAGAAEGAS